ncbi:SapC family protein [Methylobacterium planeticum]|uniref:SapC family protein n=1 Tax=Methylobacterium planeticum TaxID=2615211 RepID=A0A6N6MI84_9HYPH|nr:SapC family protein [Methylobacterium planeticum]KAB1068738.1 SapC family protein [Methylobacterium planeticum]
MSSIQPLSRERHAGLRWRRFSGYGFTATTAVAPLAAAEVGKAALALPLAFVERESGWTLAAVLSLLPGQNLYVAPNGNWIVAYVPAAFRAYPFRVAWNEAVQPVLCVDEASGLVVESGEGETFFDESGEPSASVEQVWAFLQETAKGEAVLANACGKLHAAGVIEPWPITIQGADGAQQVTGLHRINELAMNGLDDAAFGQLRRTGVVGVAYAQLLSMGNLSTLGELAQARAQAEAAERAKAEVKPMITLPEDNTIDWDWSKIGR